MARSSSASDTSALLQARVALFWKVMFFLSLFTTSVGALGTVVKPGDYNANGGNGGSGRRS